MSDTVVVMSGGKIQQIGSPQDIYNEPKNAFVARFLGDSNIVDGVMLKDFLVNFGGHDFTLSLIQISEVSVHALPCLLAQLVDGGLAQDLAVL